MNSVGHFSVMIKENYTHQDAKKEVLISYLRFIFCGEHLFKQSI